MTPRSAPSRARGHAPVWPSPGRPPRTRACGPSTTRPPPQLQEALRLHAHPGVAGQGAPGLGALQRRRLRLVRLAGRADAHQPPRGPGLHPERLHRGERLREPAGSWPPSRDKEPACPGYEVNVLMAIEDVTARVLGGVQARRCRTRRRATRARRPSRAVEKECANRTAPALRRGDRCTRARVPRSTPTRSTRTCGWSSRPRSRRPSSAATPTTSPSRATTSTSRFFRAYENGQPARRRPTFRWAGRVRRTATWSSSRATPAPPRGSTRWPSSSRSAT